MDVILLVKKAKKGDKEAMLQLIMARKDEFYKLAYTYMGNQHDSLDAMDDMIIKLYENIRQLKKEAAFYSWSKTILVNCCKDQLRKQKKLVLVEEWKDEIGATAPTSAPNQYQTREQQMDIQQLLSSLNPHQAEAIKLKYFHDLDYQSISEITHVSIGTVKSRVFEGLKKLKLLIGGNEHE